jgi:dienelactone hydrolase
MWQFLFLLLAAQPSMASVKPLAYSSPTQKMEGALADDPTRKGKRPGILIVHDWMGLGPFSENVAEKLAKQGYVALAVDMYGKGVRPKNSAEAGQLATKYKSDRALLREQIRAAYDKLLSLPGVDKKHIVVMGYCFGGTVALELARSGAPLAGAVSFHGGLSTPTPEDAKKIQGRLLVMHGADDPNVPPAEVQAFQSEMNAAHVKYKFVAYPGAVHSFTNPAAGNDNSKGAAYNAEADKKSWAELEGFLKEVAGI